MDSRDGRVVRFEDDVDMGTFDVCALDNTKENEDETRSPRLISTSDLDESSDGIADPEDFLQQQQRSTPPSQESQKVRWVSKMDHGGQKITFKTRNG